DANELSALFGNVDVLKSGFATLEVIEDMLRGKGEGGAIFTGQKFRNNIAVVYRLDFVTADGASRGKHVDHPAAQQHAVEVQYRDAEILDEIHFRIRQPKDGDKAGEVF